MRRETRSKRSWKKWQELISQGAQSGHSMAAFCRERGLSAAQFYWWRKRLEQVEAQKFVEVKMGPTVGAVRAIDSAIEIHLVAGCYLRVRPGFDAEHLQAVLAVLEPRS